MRLQNLFLILIISFVSFFVVISTSKISAAGIEISPSVIDIENGKSYSLVIKNKTNNTQSIKLNQQSFTIERPSKPLSPEENAAVIGNDIFLIYSQNDFEIEADKEVSVDVKVEKFLKDYILGTTIEIASIEDGEVSIKNALTSIVLPRTKKILEQDKSVVDTDISLKVNSILGISFSKKIEVESIIQNNSSLFLKPTGDIKVYEGKKRVGNISITPQVKGYIYPKESLSINTEYKDSRNLFNRIGKIDFVQVVNIDGVNFEVSGNIFIMPFEIIIGAVIIFLIITLVLIKSRRSNKGKSRLKVRDLARN